MNGVLVDDEYLQEEAFGNVLSSDLSITLSAQEYKDYFMGKTDQKGFEDFLCAKGNTDAKIEELLSSKSGEYKKLASTTKGTKEWKNL